MGTHPKLGEGYLSREGPCAVRLLAGNFDMLRQIAARVRQLPPHTLSPPDRETMRLRRLLWQLEQELRAERSASIELRVQLTEAKGEIDRGVRREEGAAAALERALQLAQAQAKEAARDLRKHNLLLKQENAELKSMMSSEQRVHRRAVADMELDHHAECQRQEAEVVGRLRAQEHELRQYQQRMYLERNEAQRRAEELSLDCERLSGSLERVRSTSKSSLLAEVRAATASHCPTHVLQASLL